MLQEGVSHRCACVKQSAKGRGNIAPFCGSANLPYKVSRHMGYRSDGTAILFDMRPRSSVTTPCANIFETLAFSADTLRPRKLCFLVLILPPSSIKHRQWLEEEHQRAGSDSQRGPPSHSTNSLPWESCPTTDCHSSPPTTRAGHASKDSRDYATFI